MISRTDKAADNTSPLQQHQHPAAISGFANKTPLRPTDITGHMSLQKILPQ